MHNPWVSQTSRPQYEHRTREEFQVVQNMNMRKCKAAMHAMHEKEQDKATDACHVKENNIQATAMMHHSTYVLTF